MMGYFDSFPLFDINKFMSEEQIPGQLPEDLQKEPNKRRRTPSMYAHQIADFKNVSEPLSRTTPYLPKKTRTTSS